MTRAILILAISLSVTGCLPDSSKLKINLAKQSKSESTIGAARVTSIKVINDQLVISGSHLSSVTNVQVEDSVTNENFTIESKNDNQITANSIRAISFDIGKVFNLILSNAEASATFPIDFSICHSTLNGKSIDCSLNPQPNDVLSYDADSDTWKPRAVNGLNYQGAWSALTAQPSAVSPGDYYIVSVANPPYSVGDWIVWNGSNYDRINNASTVTTVFGRPGAITANKGDYTLTKMADVDLVTDAPNANQFLKFDGTNWVPGDVAAVVESDPTVRSFAKSALPTCSAGEVLKSDGTNFSCVTDALGGFTGTANRIVTTNGSGALAVTTITDTVLGYLSGVTSNIQTQIDSKLNWAISGLETIHPSRLNLTAPNAGKAVITDGSGFVTVSATTSTQLGYLSTTTSNVQTQISAKADMTNGSQTITALAVTGLAAPSVGSDATNRTYVDTAIANNGVWAKGANSSINYTSGAVGIGINNPNHPLTILAPGSTTPDYTTWYNSASPPPIGVYSDSGPAGSMDMFMAGASSDAGIRPVVLGRKSGGTLNTPTALAVGDTIMSLLSSGYDGAAFRNNASVDFVVGDVVSAGSLPTDIIFKTGSVTRAEKMRLNHLGNLGVGTTVPDARIHIFSSLSAAPTSLGSESSIILESSPNTAGTQGYTGSVWFGSREISRTEGSAKAAGIVGFMPDDVTTTNAQSDLLFFTTKAGTVTADEKMRLSSAGFLGIGTTVPLAPVHVNVPNIGANILVSSENGYAQYLLNATTAGVERKWALKSNDGNGAFAINEDALAASNRLTILEGGNTGIGTINPGAKLEVAGTTKLGTDGVSFNSMGGCVIASTAITTTAADYTCTGVPASTAVAINCSGSAAMTTPGTSSVYCRPSGTLHTVTCNTTVANSVAMTWNCMWMKI